MLENRSYDHLFGFLGHPEIKDLEPNQYANPLDVSGTLTTEKTAKREQVGVSPTAHPRLEYDPPHGHLAAKTQLNANWRGQFQMNGFVTAYAQKLAGKVDVPVVHWSRLLLLAVPVALVLGGAGHDLSRRITGGGWSSWGRFALLVAATSGAVHVLAAALKVPAIPGLSRMRIAVGILIAAVVLGAAVAGWSRWLTVDARGAWVWATAGYAALLVAMAVAKRRMKVDKGLDPRSLRDQSKKIMSCMPPEHIPVLGALARRYTTCTAWHSSVPGATWPNRNFAHAATSDESVDIEVGFYEDLTIFEVLDREHGEDTTSRDTWRIYHHDVPQVFAFPRLWDGENRKRWFDASCLLRDIAVDDLPMYAFVEPCHNGPKSNSQHPINNEDDDPEDFARGEALVAGIYNALAARPDVFEKTVFLVTYDEHGGLFDHVPPPRTVRPDRAERSNELARRLVRIFLENRNAPFDFRHLGVRVPAVVISPWVEQGRPDDTVYDHTSIVASIRRLFAPGQPPLSRRDEHANDFLHLFVETTAPGAPIELTGKLAGSAVGCAPQDLATDAAAAGAPEKTVLLRDDFSEQLDKLSHLVRNCIGDAVPEPEVQRDERRYEAEMPGPDEGLATPKGFDDSAGIGLPRPRVSPPGPPAPPSEAVPTAELFKRYAAGARE